jgi:hypothetical protein
MAFLDNDSQQQCNGLHLQDHRDIEEKGNDLQLLEMISIFLEMIFIFLSDLHLLFLCLPSIFPLPPVTFFSSGSSKSSSFLLPSAVSQRDEGVG